MSERSDDVYKRLDRQSACAALADQYRIDLAADTPAALEWTPVLAELGEDGATTISINRDGALYSFSQIDYLKDGVVQACRVVARISEGQRLELAYWGKSAPAKILTAHRGSGLLIIGDPRDQSLSSVEINSTDSPQATLPPGVFYTVKATVGSKDGLVVSAFYEPPVTDWSAHEQAIKPGDSLVETAEGTIIVPQAFRNLYI